MPTPVLLALLIVALPLGAWAIEILHALVTRRMPAWSDKLSVAAIGGSLGLSIWMLFSLVMPGEGIAEPFSWTCTWIDFGTGAERVLIPFDVMVDNLTIVMFLVVNLVAFVVHLYSTSYMHDEERYPRFFSYLSLFSFSMLGLVVTSNLLMLFIFWELVGVCSYFLIGFFFRKQSAGDAAKKAFVVNRIGDACFMAGIFLIYSALSKAWPGGDNLSFHRIWESITLLGEGAGPWAGSSGTLTAAGLLVFMGCVTKSAQFPLHVWLPDAMEGPTPVSALIHAATMVAAGVYMIVRMFPLMAGEGYLSGDYFHSHTLTIIAWIGGITAIFAGTIALAQTDLKKGLAYSTCSQLGYMVLAVGVGSLGAGMLHLFTHAFFKACLFLAAGSVIHAVHSQEMSDMGGLRRKMPITYTTFLISCLAISGVPLFSGFVSKEAILLQAAAFGMHDDSLLSWVPFVLVAVTAVLTSFYMFRLLFLTFHGKPGDAHKFDHAHESPKAMSVPLMILAFMAVVAAGGALPANMGGEALGSNWFMNRVNDRILVQGSLLASEGLAEPVSSRLVISRQQTHDVLAHEEQANWNDTVKEFWHGHHRAHTPILLFSLLAAIVGIGGAWFFFIKNRAKDFVAGIRPLEAYRKVLVHLYYVDWFYCYRLVPTVKDLAAMCFLFDMRIIDGIVNGVGWLGRGLAWTAGRIDALGVDGAVNGTGWLAMRCGQFVRGTVTGRIQDYVKFTVVGMLILFLLVVLGT